MRRRAPDRRMAASGVLYLAVAVGNLDTRGPTPSHQELVRLTEGQRLEPGSGLLAALLGRASGRTWAAPWTPVRLR